MAVANIVDRGWRWLGAEVKLSDDGGVVRSVRLRMRDERVEHSDGEGPRYDCRTALV